MKRYAKHLSTRGPCGSIYYRRRIPTAILRAYPPTQKEIVICLGTSDRGVAEKLEKVEALRIDAEFIRMPFDVADLKNIFSSCVFNERQLRSSGQAGAGTYWIPILMYFTGARTEEIAGLSLADVVQDPVFGWYFNIVDRPSPDDDLFDDEKERVKPKRKPKPQTKAEEEEQTRLLKNGPSNRKVPVAPELIELGLFRYIEWLQAKGHKSLFPGLEHDWHDKLSGAFSKFFGRLKKQILGIDNPKKVLYSFRHTMKDAMTRANVSSKYLRRTLGHAGGDGSMTDGYGNEDVPLDVLTEEFKKIKFLPIPALPWMPGKGFVKYPKHDKEGITD